MAAGVGAGSARAPPAPAVVVGALGSVGEDMRRLGTCAQRPSAGAATRVRVAARHPGSAGVGEEADEALREQREDEAAWRAWVEEGGSGDSAGVAAATGRERD
jgi:hypothetical protein